MSEDDDLEDFTLEIIGNTDDLLARISQRDFEENPPSEMPQHLEQKRKRGRPKKEQFTPIITPQKPLVYPGIIGIPVDRSPISSCSKYPRIGKVSYGIVRDPIIGDDPADNVPPRVLKDCPIEDQPFIGFLLMKWERLEKEIDILTLPLTALRAEQAYLEKLSQEFREEFFHPTSDT